MSLTYSQQDNENDNLTEQHNPIKVRQFVPTSIQRQSNITVNSEQQYQNPNPIQMPQNLQNVFKQGQQSYQLPQNNPQFLNNGSQQRILNVNSLNNNISSQQINTNQIAQKPVFKQQRQAPLQIQTRQPPKKLGIISGGLSQLSPPKREQQFEDSLDEDEQQDIINEEENEDGDQNQSEIIEKEEKIVIHNKNQLMDLLMGDADTNTTSINQPAPQQRSRQQKPLQQQSSGIKRVPRVQSNDEKVKNSYAQLQADKLNGIQKIKNDASQKQFITPIVEKENLVNKPEQQNQNYQINTQPQVLQPLNNAPGQYNQINFVQNQNQYNTIQQMPPIMNGPQGSSYTEQLQQQLNMIMQMHNQLLQQTGQVPVALPQMNPGYPPHPVISPFQYQNQLLTPPGSQPFPQPQITPFGIQKQPATNILSKNTSSSQLNGQLPNNIQRQQVLPPHSQQSNQNRVTNNQQQKLQAALNNPLAIKSQMQNNVSAFKQEYPDGSLMAQFKIQHENPRPESNYQSQPQNIIQEQPRPFQMNQSVKPQFNPQIKTNIPNTKSNQNLNKLPSPKKYNKNEDPFKNYQDFDEYNSQNFYDDLSQNKSIISGTAYDSKPNNKNSNRDFRQRQGAQTDSFKDIPAAKRKANSQVRPSISAAGQSIVNYRPYTQKDFNQIQEKVPNRMGGLGANIGSDDWVKAKQKLNTIQEFSQNIKLQNQNTLAMSKKVQDKPPKPKEITTREKAIEFAKNVPKPKVKPKNIEKKESGGNNDDLDFLENNDMMQDFQGPSKDSPGKKMGSGQKIAYNMLEQRHQAYQDEVEKIKRSMGLKF